MTDTMTAPRFSPVLLAEPWEVWEHLLPSFDGQRRKPMTTEVEVHPSFTRRPPRQRVRTRLSS